MQTRSPLKDIGSICDIFVCEVSAVLENLNAGGLEIGRAVKRELLLTAILVKFRNRSAASENPCEVSPEFPANLPTDFLARSRNDCHRVTTRL
jgi:hypothetical protein